MGAPARLIPALLPQVRRGFFGRGSGSPTYGAAACRPIYLGGLCARLMDAEPVEDNDTIAARTGAPIGNGHTRPALTTREPLGAQLVDRSRSNAGRAKIAPIAPYPLPEHEQFFSCSNKGRSTLN